MFPRTLKRPSSPDSSKPPHRRRLVSPSWFVVPLCLVACVSSVGAKSGFTVKPPPSWVQTLDPPPAPAQPATESSYLLIDKQVRVAGTTTERFRRYVRQVASAADLGQISQLRLDFEPTYEQLTIHHIRIRRGDETRDVLRPDEIKVIQQEDELDQQLYNGTLSAVVFLNDVRLGDCIDYAYTVSGANPVLGGHYADAFALAAGAPIAHIRMRLLYPNGADRSPVHFRVSNLDLQPSMQALGAETEYVWERRDVPAMQTEDSTPAWFDPLPTIQLSEFDGWGDVVRWALPLYKAKGELSPEMTNQIEEWKGKYPDPAQRVRAARRFVQDEVRYLGIELGTYSHTPTPAPKVFNRRFGDCKDKSLLLATLLDRLGIEAHPALVNTDARTKLDDWQPSPYAFDHVIVQAKLDNRTYWIDATMSFQRGSLDEVSDLEYGRALVLRDGVTSLEEIPLRLSDVPTTSVREFYDITNPDVPATLEVVTTYRAGEANSMRYRLASQNLTELGKDYLNYYAERDASIEARGLPEVSDDEQSNVITVKEKYSIPKFWKDERRYFLADRVYQELGKPDVSRRTMPLSVSYPLNVEQETEIRLPRRQMVWTGADTISSDAFTFDYASAMQGNTLKLNYHLRTKRDHIAANNVARYLETLERARNAAGFELPQASAHSGFGIAIILGFVVVLIGTGLAVLILSKRNRREPAYAGRVPRSSNAIQSAPGAQPETAIHITDDRDIAAHVARTRCRCGATQSYATHARQSFRYDGRRLVLIPLECQSCKNNCDLYFATAG